MSTPGQVQFRVPSPPFPAYPGEIVPRTTAQDGVYRLPGGRHTDRSGSRPVSMTASGPGFRALAIGLSRFPRAAMPLEPDRQGDVRLSPAAAQALRHRERNADTGRDRRDSAYSQGAVPHPSAIALRVSIARRLVCVAKRDTFRRPFHGRSQGSGHGQDQAARARGPSFPGTATAAMPPWTMMFLRPGLASCRQCRYRVAGDKAEAFRAGTGP